MKLPKKYWKLHPKNLKKAWAHYKRDLKARKAGKKTTTKKTVKKKTTKKATTKKTGGTTMAKAKKKAKNVITKIKYRSQTIDPLGMLIRAMIGFGGGVTTSLIVNKTPVLKNMNPIVKSLLQMGLGMGTVFLLPKKMDLPKYLGVGAFTAGTYGLGQKITKMDVLAGDADLTEAEVQALLSAGYLSGPQQLSLNGPQQMTSLGAGENPNMMGAGENPNIMGNNFLID